MTAWIVVALVAPVLSAVFTFFFLAILARDTLRDRRERAREIREVVESLDERVDQRRVRPMRRQRGEHGYQRRIK